MPTVTIHRLHDQQMHLWVLVFARLLTTHHWYSRHPPSSRTGHRRCCCRRCHPVAAVIVEVLVCFSRRGLSVHWFGGLSSQWRAPARRGQQSWPRAQGRGPGTAWPWPWASVFLFLVEDESRCLAFPTTDADEDARRKCSGRTRRQLEGDAAEEREKVPEAAEEEAEDEEDDDDEDGETDITRARRSACLRPTHRQALP